jgi:chemotaxis protein CheD
VNPNEIHVQIGEIKIGKSGDLLRTVLGSCVGIAFVSKTKGLYVLAHCLLPETNENQEVLANSAKYVNEAVPLVIKLLNLSTKDIGEIEVFIAGGGNMFPHLVGKNIDHIGILNIKAARKYLGIYGFVFKELDVGGDEGRQMFIDCTSGEVFVTQVKNFT